MNDLDAARLLQQGLVTDTRCTACYESMTDDAQFCAMCGAAAPHRESEGDALRAALEAKLRRQYRIVRLLGRGGMGAVYLARDLALDREVAIKVVRTAADSRETYERFRREARMAARLSHPHIVPLHSFGEVEGMPYVVMSYVRGESLAARLRRDGRVAEPEARRAIGEIADALHHAHGQGVVHRDVKPDNILIDDESGRALLTDFGVAKTHGQGETLTQRGSVVGTPHFMSPEQASGAIDVDGRSDIYSLGVTAYAMLTGRLPFEGSSAADVLSKHLTQEPPPLRALMPELSDSTVQAVERCMAKDPAKRWADGRALEQAIGVTLDGDVLPDSLEAVSGHGVPYVALSAVLLLVGWMVVIRMQGAPLSVLAVMAGGLAAGYLALTVSLRIEGFPLALIQRTIWTEPRWWRSWYPRALRRRGNVWDRLPASVRRCRAFMPSILVAFVAFAIEASAFFFVKLAVLLAVTFLSAALQSMARRELMKNGLGARDANRFVFRAPLAQTAFWSQPHIAALLAPGDDTNRRTATPHDQLQSILRIADKLSTPLRPLAAQSAAAARQLLAAIDEADREMAELARNIEPGEAERLAAKIDAFRADDASPMRALLEKQLDLIRGLQMRIEEARARRERRVEMLRNLALQVVSLETRPAENSGEISDRVRVLCDDIASQSTTVVARQ